MMDRPTDSESANPADALTRTAVFADERRLRTERGDLPAARASADATDAAPGGTGEVGLLGDDDLATLRAQWERVQIAFVDQPREAVQQAHDLVDRVVDRLTQSFAQQRDRLEGTWSSGDEVDTEALRLALQRYRSFFNRLLST